MEFRAIKKENDARKKQLAEREHFDPIEGLGCSGERVEIPPELWTGNRRVFVPREMTEDPQFSRVRSVDDWEQLRIRYDFEFWAATCCHIKHKDTGAISPFILNRPQRRVVKMLEADRRAGRPMRIVILKARQWGGSTVVEMYMAWLQLVVTTHRHAIVCGAEKTGSQVVLNLYSDMLAYYPPRLWEGEKPPSLRTSRGIFELSGRDNRVYVAASTNPNAIRGVDAALVHLTEVAYWKSSPSRDPWDAVRAIYCSVAMAPMTMIVLESTADGVGSFFHEEWLRAERGESNFKPLFVAWHEIDRYRLEFSDENEMHQLWREMDLYERELWNQGLTLEQIHWYHRRRRELKQHSKMKSEFPSNAEEAFCCSSTQVFASEKVTQLRKECCEPLTTGNVTSATGELIGPASLRNVAFEEDGCSDLQIWEFPERQTDYMVSIDIGGLHEKSDWSVILVMTVGLKPRVVAQMRVHLDHDLLVWKAAQIGTYYNNAKLVFESNTLESGRGHNAESPYPQGALILNELREYYPELYTRPSGLSGHRLPGFHTNRSTKQMIITRLVGAVRDGRYTERSHDACDEFNYYERLPSGNYAAREGKHDDLLMARAILLQAIHEEIR